MPHIKWELTVGAMINAALLLGGFIWAASAFAAKTTTDTDMEKKIATDLRTRIELLDTRTALQDSRTAVLERDVVYIRESLARIELNTTKKP